MKVLCTKNLRGGLDPTDEEGKTVFSKWKVGDCLWAEVRKARNGKYHKLYMALLHLVFENQERYANFEVFRKAVEFAAGHVEVIPSLDGEPLMQVRSIAWDQLDEIEFGKLFPLVMRICVDTFLQGTDMEYLRDEVLRYAA